MNDSEKAMQLNRHKLLATGLFVLMLLVYAAVTWYQKAHAMPWTGYLKAFSEAAMVGALADWFAVTALFNHPLGIPIPHTNLIENSKKSIGDNLGSFVVGNFLTATNIRPYISKLAVSSYLAGWLGKERNQQLLLRETSKLLKDILLRIEPAAIAPFLAKKGADLLKEIPLHQVAANALTYFLDKNEQQELVTILARKIKTYIMAHQQMVQEKVKAESYFFIPRFVDNKLASKITNGLATYFEEVELDPAHRIRVEIAEQLYLFAAQLRSEPRWEQELSALTGKLLSSEKLEAYASSLWQSLRNTLLSELEKEDGTLITFFQKTIGELSSSLETDAALREKIDGWIRFTAYKYILRNTLQVGTLISTTVGNWEGRELSRKLELEVGKDLQFIRINGTIVGGLMGLLIHSITALFG